MSVPNLSADDVPPWFDASPELRRLLDRNLSPQRLNAGQTLFEQGDFDDRLYVLDEGTLEVSVIALSGRKLSLNRLQAGSVFGEIAIFDPGPRTARIEALTDCRLRAIRQRVLFDAIADAPELAQELLRLAGKRMRWLSQQVEEHVFMTPASRLAAKILHLAGSSGEISMSQAQLAEFVGVTREVVSKTLTEWRRADIVDVMRGRIVLRDVDALEVLRDADVL